ncbi:MAG: ion channel [Mucinivorans sp.]
MKILLKSLNALVILGSITIIAVLSVELLLPRVMLDQSDVLNIQLAVCIIFMTDFIVSGAAASNKWRYFWRNIVFFLIAIPYLNILHYTSIHVSHEAYFVIRLIPLIRGGFGIAIVISFFTRSRIASLFITYVVTIIATAYFASLVFYALEKGINPSVTNFSDALWWAFMDVTTVGSNVYAVTGVGKVMSVILAGAGMMMFPIFTAYITSKFQTMIRAPKVGDTADPVNGRPLSDTDRAVVAGASLIMGAQPPASVHAQSSTLKTMDTQK